MPKRRRSKAFWKNFTFKYTCKLFYSLCFACARRSLKKEFVDSDPMSNSIYNSQEILRDGIGQQKHIFFCLYPLKESRFMPLHLRHKGVHI